MPRSRTNSIRSRTNSLISLFTNSGGSLNSLKGESLKEFQNLRSQLISVLQGKFGESIEKIFSSIHILLNRYRLEANEFEELSVSYQKAKMLTPLIIEAIGFLENAIIACLKQKSPRLDNIENIIFTYIENEQIDNKIQNNTNATAALTSLSEKIKKINKAIEKKTIETSNSDIENIFYTFDEFEKGIRAALNPPKKIIRKSSSKNLFFRRLSFSSDKTYEDDDNRAIDKNEVKQINSKLKLNLKETDSQNNKIYYNHNFIRSLTFFMRDNAFLVGEASYPILKDILEVLNSLQTYNYLESHPLYHKPSDTMKAFYANMMEFQGSKHSDIFYANQIGAYIDRVILLPRTPFFQTKTMIDYLTYTMIYVIFKPVYSILEEMFEKIQNTKFNEMNNRNEYISLKLKKDNRIEEYNQFLGVCSSILKTLYTTFPSIKALFKRVDEIETKESVSFKIKNEFDNQLEKLMLFQKNDKKIERLRGELNEEFEKFLFLRKRFQLILANQDPCSLKTAGMIFEYLYKDSSLKNTAICELFYKCYEDIREKLILKKSDRTSTLDQNENNVINLVECTVNTDVTQRTQIDLFTLNENIHIFDGNGIISMTQYLESNNNDVGFLFFNLFEKFTLENIYNKFQPFHTQQKSISRTQSAPTEKMDKEEVELPGKSHSFG